MLMTGGVPLKRRWIATILLTAMLLTLTACSLPQDLPGGMATLTGRVTSKDERLLTVEVLEDNLHYDAGTIILVKYRALTGATSLSVGEAISVTYSYLENVTVQDKLSCITVESVPQPRRTKIGMANVFTKIRVWHDFQA